MDKWQAEFEWYVEYYKRNDQLPGRVAIANWRGVSQCDWPQVLLRRGLVCFNEEGSLMFTDKGRAVVRADIIKDIGEVVEKYV